MKTIHLNLAAIAGVLGLSTETFVETDGQVSLRGEDLRQINAALEAKSKNADHKEDDDEVKAMKAKLSLLEQQNVELAAKFDTFKEEVSAGVLLQSKGSADDTPPTKTEKELLLEAERLLG